MEEHFIMGIKNDLYNLLRRFISVMIIWMIISTVLVNLLFAYFEYYIGREDAKVYYEVQGQQVEREIKLEKNNWYRLSD